MNKALFPLLALLFLCSSSAMGSSPGKFSPWKGNRFVSTPDFQLVRLTKGAKSSPVPIQLEVSQKGIWLRSESRVKGKLQRVRTFVLPLRSGKVPVKFKMGKKAKSYVVPRLEKALDDARIALKKDLELRRFDFLRITTDSRSVKLVRIFSLLLDKRIPYRTITEILVSAGRAGFLRYLFAGCARVKNNPCALRYLPVIAPEMKVMRQLSRDIRKFQHQKSILNQKAPLTLTMLLIPTRLYMKARNVMLRKGCPVKKLLMGAPLKGKETNFLAGGRLKKNEFTQCLRKFKTLHPPSKFFTLSAHPSVTWKSIASVLEAARVRGKNTMLLYPHVFFSVVI